MALEHQVELLTVMNEVPGDFSRRKVIVGTAWTVPVIAGVSATPAFAASNVGSVPINRLRIGDYRLENRNAGGLRGPIYVFVPAYYDQNIAHDTDPALATVPWTISVAGPLGAGSRTGSIVIAKYNYHADGFYYPYEGATDLLGGTYTFTLTIYGSDGAKTGSASITL